MSCYKVHEFVHEIANLGLYEFVHEIANLGFQAKGCKSTSPIVIDKANVTSILIHYQIHNSLKCAPSYDGEM